MVLPTQQQFIDFIREQGKRAYQAASSEPFLSTLAKTLKQLATPEGDPDGKALADFFEHEHYRRTTSELKGLIGIAQGSKKKQLQGLKTALGQVHRAFVIIRHLLSFEAVDRTRAFPEKAFQVDRQGRLQAITITLQQLEESKAASALAIQGVSKKVKGEQVVFVAGPDVTPAQLFDRAFLELDPYVPVVFSGGTEQACETLALLCMANDIPWSCPSFKLEKAELLEREMRRLRHEGKTNTTHPPTVFVELGKSKIPGIGHYYMETCLAADPRRKADLIERVRAAGAWEKKKAKSHRGDFFRPAATSSFPSARRAGDFLHPRPSKPMYGPEPFSEAADFSYGETPRANPASTTVIEEISEAEAAALSA